MSLAEGNLRKALRDETRMVLGQSFAVSSATDNTITVFDTDRQSLIYMTGPSSNVFVGCLLRFTSGTMKGLYFLITNCYSGVTTPLVLVLDSEFPDAVEQGTTFEVFSVPPAYNGQSNVSSFNVSIPFAANSQAGYNVVASIAPGQVFSTRSNRYMLLLSWSTPCPISVLVQNATAFQSDGSVELLTDLASFVLPAVKPPLLSESKCLTLGGLFTGPSNLLSYNTIASGVQSLITATLIGPTESVATGLNMSVFSL